jgi:lipopolysaccharide transport system ATP-binding protein
LDRDIAIDVRDLGKRYRIGGKQGAYRTLRETLTETAAAPFRGLPSTLRRTGSGRERSRRSNEIWALRDVSFQVRRGETVGIIGRNGAGKSTLLKILSRITAPTSGYADIQGRVGSLLEVGTGFHPELTGRENTYLNGAIIGMKRVEISRKFDEIVAFAEVEKFIDTPVKHYSSGMYLRLAFSVAAHLEPEILLIDEVLAVGDMAFQKKCLGKMEDVAAEGRTVLFVSHNLGAVKELCQTCLVLDDGGVGFYGSALEGVAFYSRDSLGNGTDKVSTNRGTRWTELRVNDRDCRTPVEAIGLESFSAAALLEVQDTFVGARFKCRLDDAAGNTLLAQVADHKELRVAELSAGIYQIRVEFPPLWLVPGIYTLYFKFSGSRLSGAEEEYKSERVMINVIGNVNGKGRALLAPLLSWSLTREVEVGV